MEELPIEIFLFYISDRDAESKCPHFEEDASFIQTLTNG